MIYRFGISYCDKATEFVGLLLVDVIADSPEQASREIEGAKHNRTWLVAAFGPDFDLGDFDPYKAGIVIGEHVLIDVGAGHAEERGVDEGQLAPPQANSEGKGD